MNLNAITKRLNQLQNKGGGSKKDKIDYSTIYWKPKSGKHVVRIVPSKFDKDYPFREVFFHYGLTRAPIMALNNFGEKDPVQEFASKLYKEDDKESKDMAKKLFPKMRIFAPVLVRGEEEKGVRLWEFGKQVYQELLSMAEDEDIGDFTDLLEGRDMLVTKKTPEEEGNLYGSVSIRPRTKVTPLTEDDELVGGYLNEQPDIFTLYKRYDFDSLKEVLQSWLKPEEEEETTPPVVEESTNYTLNGAANKTSKSDEFDDIFGDDKSDGSEDDLPF
jgi:hypothetical protein